jgi:type I restriction enzyme S subunit
MPSVSDLAEVNPKRQLPAGLSLYEEVSFIPMGDVSEAGEWVSQQVRSLKDVLVGFTPFLEGDVLFAKITPCMENGKGTHATGLANGVGFGSTEFHVLRARPNVSARFVFHLAQSKRLRLAAEAHMIGSAGQQRVQKQFFDKYEVFALSFAEQQKIAQILDTLDTQIRQTEALIAKLERMKLGLLTDLLTRGIDRHGQIRPTPDQAPHLYKDSPLGWIPIEWKVAPLSSLADVRSGATPSRALASRYFASDGTPWVKTMDLNEDVLTETDEKVTVAALRESSCAVLPSGTVLIAMYGGWEQIGRTGMLGTVATTNQAISALEFSDKQCIPEFVLRAVQHGRPRWKSIAASTRKDPNITKADVESFQIALPSSADEQKMIVTRFRALLRRIDCERATLRTLEQEKVGLGDDLLTGQVRVTPLLGTDQTSSSESRI